MADRFWFVSSNGWLDGDAPMGRLEDVDHVIPVASCAGGKAIV